MQRIIVYFAFKIKDGLYIGNNRSPNVSTNYIFIIRKKSSSIKIKLPMLSIVQDNR